MFSECLNHVECCLWFENSKQKIELEKGKTIRKKKNRIWPSPTAQYQPTLFLPKKTFGTNLLTRTEADRWTLLPSLFLSNARTPHSQLVLFFLAQTTPAVSCR